MTYKHVGQFLAVDPWRRHVNVTGANMMTLSYDVWPYVIDLLPAATTVLLVTPV